MCSEPLKKESAEGNEDEVQLILKASRSVDV